VTALLGQGAQLPLEILAGGPGAELGRVAPHLVQPVQILKPLEVMQTPVHEVGGLDPARHEPRRLRDEDLARPGLGANARGQVHRAAEEVPTLLDRLTGVDADAERDADGLRLAGGLQRALNGDRALDGGAGRPEGHHEAVALGLHHVTAGQLHLAPHDAVVVLEHAEGRLVPVLLGVFGEPADVAEEDGDGGPQREGGPGGGGVARRRPVLGGLGKRHV
jgi:hypothetical protein